MQSTAAAASSERYTLRICLFCIIIPPCVDSMGTIADKNTESCEFYVRYCTLAPTCGIIHSITLCDSGVTAFAVRFDTDQREAVPIEPKQQRHISTEGVKTTAGATNQPGAPAPKNRKTEKAPQHHRHDLQLHRLYALPVHHGGQRAACCCCPCISCRSRQMTPRPLTWTTRKQADDDHLRPLRRRVRPADPRRGPHLARAFRHAGQPEKRRRRHRG